MWRHLPAAFLVLALGGACAMDDRAVDPADMPAAPGASTEPPPASSTPETEPSPSVTESVDDAVVGQVVRFTSERTHVDVTISDDGPAVRDFLELLPLELTVEEFSGREKIADLPRELEMAGTPGSDPDDGDLIYYAPCGGTSASITTPPASASPIQPSPSAPIGHPRSSSPSSRVTGSPSRLFDDA
jgi:Cyclophilin-like family